MPERFKIIRSIKAYIHVNTFSFPFPFPNALPGPLSRGLLLKGKEEGEKMEYVERKRKGKGREENRKIGPFPGCNIRSNLVLIRSCRSQRQLEKTALDRGRTDRIILTHDLDL